MFSSLPCNCFCTFTGPSLLVVNIYRKFLILVMLYGKCFRLEAINGPDSSLLLFPTLDVFFFLVVPFNYFHPPPPHPSFLFLTGHVEEYQLPYFDLVEPVPSFEDMKKVVVDDLRRPGIPSRWHQSEVRSQES